MLTDFSLNTTGQSEPLSPLKKTEAQRAEATSPRSHSQKEMQLGHLARLPDSRAHIPNNRVTPLFSHIGFWEDPKG